MNFRSILGSTLVLVSAAGLLHGTEVAVPISAASKDASPSTTAAGMSGSPGFAGDGGSVFFLSDAANLNAPPRQRPVLDLYRRDPASGFTERVFPRRSDSDLPDGDIEAFSVSSRGDRVAAATRAANLWPGDTNGVSDVVLRNLASGAISCLSCGPNGEAGSHASGNPILSADGRWVLFESLATNLTSLPDSNGVRDVFLRDIDSGTTTVVSATTEWGLFNSPSRAMALGPDGEFLVFRSDATNRPAPSGISSDLWVGWRSRGTVTRVELGASTPRLTRTVLNVALSENGRGLVCRTDGETNAIWWIDVDTGIAKAISGNLLSGKAKVLSQQISTDLIPPDARAVSISSDGGLVAFLGIPPGTEEVRAYLWSAAGGLREVMTQDPKIRLLGLELSPDGAHLAFLTAEPVPQAGVSKEGSPRWYVRNLTSGQAWPVGPESSGNLSREAPVFNARGDALAFQTAAVLPGIPDSNSTDDVFLAPILMDHVDLVSQRHPEVSLMSGGGPSTLWSGALSHNGRFVAFTSAADNLVPNDSNGRRDVFVRDLVAGTNALVSVGLDGRSGQGESWQPRISANGRRVVFTSIATNLVAGVGSSLTNVYVRDLDAGTTVMANVQDRGDEKAKGDALNPRISADGETVTFESTATNLVAGVAGSAPRLYLRHMASQRTLLVSGALNPSTVEESKGSFGAVLDTVGRRVVFLSGTAAHLYSVSDGSVVQLTANIGVATLSLSQDGTRLAMLGNLTNVANRRAVYWRDLATTTNCLIAAANNSYSSQNIFANVVLSADGRRVVFESNFIAPGSTDTNTTMDVFAFDISSGVLSLVSKAVDTNRTGNGASDSPVLSADGEWVAFRSAASDLVTGDTNRSSDIFVRNLTKGTVSLVSRRAVDGAPGNGGSSRPLLSGTGGTVVFQSLASDLMPGDYNLTSDLFTSSLGTGAEDTDGDGMPDAWELSHGLDPASPVDSTLDSDGDGLSNLAEFTAGTDPRDANSRLAMTSIAWTPGSVALGWSCVAGKRYRIQVSENLSDWTTVRLGDDPLVVLGSASGTASVDVPSGTSLTDRRYYRVEVVRP